MQPILSRVSFYTTKLQIKFDPRVETEKINNSVRTCAGPNPAGVNTDSVLFTAEFDSLFQLSLSLVVLLWIRNLVKK